MKNMEMITNLKSPWLSENSLFHYQTKQRERELCGGCEYQVLIWYKRLNLYTLTSACIFSILFSIDFHRG